MSTSDDIASLKALRGWTNQLEGKNPPKTWARIFPFHRIYSPSWRRPGMPHVASWQEDCGCRAKKTFEDKLDALSSSRLLALVPSWAPVITADGTWNGTLGKVVAPDPEHQEVEGMLSGSFQTWVDVPYSQWHLYYDWNFLVNPHPSCEWLMTKDQSVFECEWDCGGFGHWDWEKKKYAGPMFHKDWAWPMAGQPVWLAGRWIYDCGHIKEEKEEGHAETKLCAKTELHPCKAVASARWEGVEFSKEDKCWPPNADGPTGGPWRSPAIQFMFFASKYGGYHDFDSIDVPGGKGYTFILDLPNCPVGADGRYPIKREGKNTIDTPQAWLMKKLSIHNFNDPECVREGKTTTLPQVDVNPYWAPGEENSLAPRQVSVEISPQGQSADAAGFLLSLGWVAPKLVQPRLMKCTVAVNGLNISSVGFKLHLKEPFDYVPQRWLFRAGINGRWHSADFDVVPQDSDYPFPFKTVLYLTNEDEIVVSLDGAQVLNGKIFDTKPVERREIKVNDEHGESRAVKWEEDIVNGSPEMVNSIISALEASSDSLTAINFNKRLQQLEFRAKVGDLLPSVKIVLQPKLLVPDDQEEGEEYAPMQYVINGTILIEPADGDR